MSQETNWFQDLSVDQAKAERGYWRRIGFAIFTGIVLALILWPALGRAAPILQAVSDDGVTITLHDDACQLAAVVNLAKRITWEEKGETFEGCYGRHPSGIIIAYFSDKKVALFPERVFRAVRGA